MEKAIQLNNQGVCLIERRLYCDAIRMCTKALEQAKRTLRKEDKNEEKNDSGSLEQESENLNNQQDDNSSIREQSISKRLKRRRVISVLSLILTCSSKHTEVENSEESVEADNCYIYRTPIRIISSTQQMDDSSVTLLFNLALALHLDAIERKSKATLEWALKLYEIGYKLQMRHCVRITFSQILGLVNNCGQIHRQLGRERKANLFFGHLHSLLVMLAVDCGKVEQVEELDGFILTSLHPILCSKDPRYGMHAAHISTDNFL